MVQDPVKSNLDVDYVISYRIDPKGKRLPMAASSLSDQIRQTGLFNPVQAPDQGTC